AHVESRFCDRKRRGKAALDVPVNPCVRSVCSRSVAVGLLCLKEHKGRRLFQGGYTGRRVVEVPSMDTRTTDNIPVPTLAGVIGCDSPPRRSNMADGTRASAGSIRWPCESGDPTLLRGNP